MANTLNQQQKVNKHWVPVTHLFLLNRSQPDQLVEWILSGQRHQQLSNDYFCYGSDVPVCSLHGFWLECDIVNEVGNNIVLIPKEIRYYFLMLLMLNSFYGDIQIYLNTEICLFHLPFPNEINWIRKTAWEPTDHMHLLGICFFGFIFFQSFLDSQTAQCLEHSSS